MKQEKRCTVIWTDEKADAAIKLLTSYFEKWGVGEMIMQSDDPIIEAPSLLADIANEILIEGEGIVFDNK